MSELTTRALAPTPLHARTAELCATNQWSAQGGFTIPGVFSTEREELEALTTRAGLSDLSARQCWVFDGPDAANYLSFATVSDVTGLEPGQTAHTVWCDDGGHVRGDGTIVRYGKQTFELSSHVRDYAWLLDGARGFDLKVSNATGQRAGIGVRGPLAANLLSLAGFSATPQKSGDMIQPSWRQAQVSLLRDASGEGFELWSQADDGIVVWDRLWRSGAALGVSAVGATALETVRIENGLPKAGVDWQPAQLALTDTDFRLPADLGVKPDSRRRYNGALQVAKAERGQAFGYELLSAPEKLVTGVVTARGAPAGAITSQVWSASRERSFAIGWVKSEPGRNGNALTAQGLKGAVPVEFMRNCFLEVSDRQE